MFHIEKVEQVFRQHPCGDTHAEIFSKRHIAMSKRKYMLIIALIFSTIAGCSSKRDWRVIGKPVDYTFRQEKEGLTVAIEPWTRSKDIRALFKKNIGNRTLALKIVMFNHGENTIRFSSTQAKLCLADGRTSSVLPTSEVSKRLESNEAAVAAIITLATGGYGGIISGIVAGAKAERNWKRQSAARNCSMNLATLDPGEALAGFLFYDLTPSIQINPHAYLKINRISRSAGNSISFSVKFSVLEKGE